MELSEMVEFARKFSVMVRTNGPDPKGLKMGNHAFHLYHSGKTTLSASGLILPRNLQEVVNNGICESGTVVVTVASIVEPFLTQESKLNNKQGVPELIPGAQIDVMVEVKARLEQNPGSPDNGNAKWFGARVLRLVEIPSSSSAIQLLAEASSGSSEHRWEVGWSLAARSDSSQKQNDSEQSQAKSSGSLSDIRMDRNLMGKAAARIAFLLLPSLLEDIPEVMVSPTNKRGDFLLSVGSPFGILSPLHFCNSISVGSVANCFPSFSGIKSLLMADIRCLPGMEGGPVFGQNASLVGILNQPLRQAGGTEIQVIIPWSAIQDACTNLFQPGYQESDRGLHSIGTLSGSTTTALNDRAAPNIVNDPVSCFSAPLAVEQVMTSVCLITLDNGVWASGILLNNQGLILTNAHLLEPWRFGRAIIQSRRAESSVKGIFTSVEDSMAPGNACENKSEAMQSNASEYLDNLGKSRVFQLPHQIQSQIRVRVDLMNSWLWLNARIVYISKGPLDISLLQLESVPHQLCPIGVDLTCPLPGSKAFVIGHGLLGPRCDLLPSISCGVVAKVVKAKMAAAHPSALQNSHVAEVPVMLETTASVHPGSSGGVVLNSSGHMVALVTSNAKHGGGKVIPHMNFSIPSVALEPIFTFAKDMQNISVLQQLDRPDADLASVWAMMPRISPEPDPLLHGVNELFGKENQVKGSRFAKFINERPELLGKRHLNATEDLSRDIIPSKL